MSERVQVKVEPRQVIVKAGPDAIAVKVGEEKVSLVTVGVQGPPGGPGPQGEPGEPGEPGVSDKHYVHNQGAASATWTINHNLGKEPSVSVVDSGGNGVIGQVVYVDLNTVRLEFSAPFGGKAYLN